MIVNELSLLYGGGLDVTISVPEGETLALKTFNPKLGIIGGISIIGTSGIVKPFSSEAFVDAIRKEVEVAYAINAERLVINSGAKSEKFVRSLYPNLPPQAFVHYGNFIGETLKIAAETGFKGKHGDYDRKSGKTGRRTLGYSQQESHNEQRLFKRNSYSVQLFR